MSESGQDKIEALSRILKKIGEINNAQRNVIESLATVQLEMEEAGMKSNAARIGEVVANASQNEEIFRGILDDIQMELNRLKQE